ncbi:MAG: ECF transporter S component [Oscillospiraceae bacterium]|nr:ECF transporter S component [Oscillospiraceae bacterium]
MKTSVLQNPAVKTKSLTVLIAVICAVALPQVFHILGAVSGFGAMPGATFLPMQIPVLVAGFLGGPIVGLLAGVLSPAVSFGFTAALGLDAMPAGFMLPYMTLELAGYGFMAGLLCKINPKMPIFVNLVIAQLFGRAVRAVAVLIAVYVIGLNNPAPTAVASIWEAVVAGLPGIVLQWALIPLIVYRAKGMKQKPLA